MYNDKIKKDYLEYKDNAASVKELFTESEKYEKEYDKDLCNMETSELVHFIVSYKWLKTALDKRIQVSNYIEWCVIKGYTKFNWLSPKVISRNEIIKLYGKAHESLYISREKYEVYKSRLMESDHGVSVASLFCAIYEGLAGAKLHNLAVLRRCDINEENNIVKLADGRSVKISEELKDMLIETSNVSEIKLTRVTKFENSLFVDSIWRVSSKTKNVTAETMRQHFFFLLRKIREILNMDVNVKDIEASGYFNKIYFTMLDEGIDAKIVNDEEIIDNKAYSIFFENERYNGMNMTKFLLSFQSYINQV